MYRATVKKCRYICVIPTSFIDLSQNCVLDYKCVLILNKIYLNTTVGPTRKQTFPMEVGFHTAFVPQFE